MVCFAISYVFTYHVVLIEDKAPRMELLNSQSDASPANERLHKMQLLLAWEGGIKRSRLIELFGLSPIRASEWLREFRDAYPEWVLWDAKERSHLATAVAMRDFQQPAARTIIQIGRYLGLIGLPAASPDKPTGNVVWATSSTLAAPTPLIFSALNTAIRTRRQVAITYMSMANPSPHQRLITPHSLVLAGRRWHVRAWCELRGEFRDFVLGRITKVEASSMPARMTLADDESWNKQVPVKLVPHPALTQEQAKVIRFEFFRGTAAWTETCRAALIRYYIDDVGAALDPDIQRPPAYQLAVGNLKELRPWTFQP